MGKLNNVTCQELQGSPTFHGDNNGLRATRRFYCADEAAWVKLLNGLMGTHELDRSSVKAKVIYTNPRLPLPGWPNTFCAAWEVDPLMPDSPKGNQSATADYAKLFAEYGGGWVVTAHYDTRFHANVADVHPKFLEGLPTNSWEKGTYVTYTREFGGEVMLCPAGTFLWRDSSSNEKVGNGLQPGIVIPSTIHTVTWHPIIAPPWSAMDYLNGRVNSSSFLGIAAGNMLFLGCQPKPVFRFQGGTDAGGGGESTYYDLVYRFASQSKYLTDDTTVRGWNYLYNSVASSSEHWQKVVNSSNETPYKEGAFSQLFRYEVS